MRVRPYRTVANVIDGVVITFEDTTASVAVQLELQKAKRALQRAEERWRLINGLTGEGVYEIAESDEIVFANTACAEMFGYAVEEFIGKHWSDVVPPDEMEAAGDVNERLGAGNTVEGDRLCVHRDGHTIRIHYRAGPIFREGETTGIIGTVRMTAGPE